MLQDLLNHEPTIQQCIQTNPISHDWKQELLRHQLYLYYLQQERLIHLLVTLTVAITTIITCAVVIFNPNPLLGILAIFLILLLIPYILHYRKLENTVQRWYALSTQLESKINGV